MAIFPPILPFTIYPNLASYSQLSLLNAVAHWNSGKAAPLWNENGQAQPNNYCFQKRLLQTGFLDVNVPVVSPNVHQTKEMDNSQQMWNEASGHP